jgi:prepilin-type N-terminal cleavage/methylation domain-containing protein
MKTSSRHGPRRAFTLLEALVSLTVVAVVAAAVLPVVAGAGDALSSSHDVRTAATDATLAVERTIILLRDVPRSAQNPSELALAVGEMSRVRLADGTGVELSGSELRWRSSSGTSDLLASGVEAFEVRYLARPGLETTPVAASLFEVRVVVRGFELRSAVFARSRRPS